MIFNSLLKKNLFILLSAVALYLTAAIAEQRTFNTRNNYIQQAEYAQKVILKEQQRINNYLDSLNKSLSKIYVGQGYSINNLMRKNKIPPNGLKVFIYFNNELIFWSDNALTIEINEMQNVPDMQVAFYKNGWYEFFQRKNNSFNIKALWLLKKDYSVVNEYLVNTFNPLLQLPSELIITTENNKGALNSATIQNGNDEFLFALKFPEITPINYPLYISVLYLLAFGFFHIYLFLIARPLISNYKLIYLPIFILVSFLIRWVLFKWQFPVALYDSILFDSQFFAGPYFMRSLGDLFLSSITACFASALIFKAIKRIRLNAKLTTIPSRGSLFTLLLIGIMFGVAAIFDYTLNSLIINSRISFQLNKYDEISFFSIFGMAIIATLLFTFFLIITSCIRLIIKTRLSLLRIILLYFTGALLFVFAEFYFDIQSVSDIHEQINFMAVFMLMLMTFAILYNYRKITFLIASVLVALYSLYNAVSIYSYTDHKEQEEKISFAQRLENESDNIAEYLFSEMKLAVSKDKYLPGYFTKEYERTPTGSVNLEVIEKKITELMSSYWRKYDRHIKVFDKNGDLLSSPSDTITTIDKYTSFLNREGEPGNESDFYYVTIDGQTALRGVLQVKDAEDQSLIIGTVVLEFNPKVNREIIGLPVLLLDNSITSTMGKKNYSYARYVNGSLADKNGNMPFYFRLDEYTKIRSDKLNDVIKSFNGASLLFHDYGKNKTLVLSQPKEPIVSSLFTLWVYDFAFIYLIYVISLIVFRLFRYGFVFRLDYRRRIQFNVILIVAISMLLLGGITVTFINSQYNTRQQERILENLNTTALMIENDLDQNAVNLNGKYNEQQLLNLARIAESLKSDFNIFDISGKLIYTTQPYLFERKLIGNRMNRNAFTTLRFEPVSNLQQQEKIGNLKYLAAYEPLYDKSNQLIAYLNVPFFSNQVELKKEISSVLVSLINIYVPLLGLCLLITLLITRRLVKPLQLIQQSMAKVGFGKRNELIEWSDQTDEISQLVNQYNKMVAELTLSAQKLAKSERESAWREMAKQVAHEIKNPLTPMKLSVQHLQRAWRDQHPNIDVIIKRLTETLTEQIDTLSTIATEFSNFAKMPSANNEVIDLNQVIKNAVQLFNSHQQIEIKFANHDSQTMNVFADREQMVRVFSNLLKNSIQAIPESKKGIITILVKPEDGNYIIAVSDNGIGIGEDKKEKIFVPNFTTKSTGTGLGLAMVKSIIETSNGKIWFTSILNKGTTFYVQLPKYFEE